MTNKTKAETKAAMLAWCERIKRDTGRYAALQAKLASNPI